MLLDQGVLYAASVDGSVEALQASNGQRLWDVQTGKAEIEALTVQEDVVYLSAGTALTALQAKSGKPLWQFQMDDDIGSILPGSNGVVYAGTVYSGSHVHSLYALDAHSGDLLWRYQTTAFAMHAAQVSDGVVYATSLTPQTNSTPATLYALRASDGVVLWHYQGEDYFNRVEVQNGVIYLGGDESYQGKVYVLALQASDGKVLWRYQNDEIGGAISNVSNGLIYLTSVGEVSHILALSASDGAPLWSYEIAYHNHDLTEPVVVS